MYFFPKLEVLNFIKERVAGLKIYVNKNLLITAIINNEKQISLNK